MTEEQNKLAEAIERILAEYHRAVELDDASLLPKIMSQWCDLFFKPGASAILAGLREPATEAVLELQGFADSFAADDEGLHLAPENWNRMRELIHALKGKGASQGAGEFVRVPRTVLLECRNRISSLWEKEKRGAFSDLAMFLGTLDTLLSAASPDEQKAKP